MAKGLTAIALIFGCTSPENDRTKISLGVYRKKEIRIENQGIGENFLQIANVVDGDSTVFMYSEFTDRGEESDGYIFVFTIPDMPDSLRYSPGANEKLVIGFGTGMAPNFADTIKFYDFNIITMPSSIRISGVVGTKNISGTYIPK
ncbi:MAG: hypothetical protein M3Y08_18430 [Fibrobacterota bacterium]|nr:hypothetical protein [Fibrobacterota bacterium]